MVEFAPGPTSPRTKRQISSEAPLLPVTAAPQKQPSAYFSLGFSDTQASA